ncbi:MAG TPA: hypothetical protein VEQ58_03340 [Polyangiaceae bacterium]|nr:hypothetical protein [Polyangiaceae bacterium]
MKSSALVLVAGISIFGAGLGCDSAGDDAGTAGTSTGGGKISAGGSNTTTGGSSSGSGGGSSSADGISITWTDSWVDLTSNPLGIQGAIFSYGDDTSKMGMMENFKGANACIQGSAAKVDTGCTPVAPATDCYGTFWGAAIGLNLNQPKDANMMGGTAVAYDASHVKGFTFTVGGTVAGSGDTMVPSTMRFKVEDANKEYCTWKTISPGQNTVLFSELETECWNHAKTPGTSAETAKSGLIKIAWQVVTTTGGPTPFDYCVSDLHVLTDGTVGAGGSPSGSGGTPAATGGTPAATGGTPAATGGGGAATGGGGASSGGGGAASGGASAGAGGAKGGSGGTGGG